MPHWDHPSTEATLNPSTREHGPIYKLLAFLNPWQIVAPPPQLPAVRTYGQQGLSSKLPLLNSHTYNQTHTQKRGRGKPCHALLDNWAACWGGSRAMDPLLPLSWDVRKLCWDYLSALLELRDVVSVWVVGSDYRRAADMWEFIEHLSASSWWQPVCLGAARWDVDHSLLCSVH